MKILFIYLFISILFPSSNNYIIDFYGIDIMYISDNTIVVSGIASTMALGNADPAPDAMITGIAMTMNDGDPGPIQGDATVIPTGNALTITAGTANTLIWNQVNTGTAPTWKEVDTAA